MEKLESTYNKSIKVMFGMPWATHRYLIEPLTGQPHLRKVLIKRYLSFIERIKASKKKPLRNLLEYHSIPKEEYWKINLVQELIDI